MQTLRKRRIPYEEKRETPFQTETREGNDNTRMGKAAAAGALVFDKNKPASIPLVFVVVVRNLLKVHRLDASRIRPGHPKEQPKRGRKPIAVKHIAPPLLCSLSLAFSIRGNNSITVNHVIHEGERCEDYQTLGETGKGRSLVRMEKRSTLPQNDDRLPAGAIGVRTSLRIPSTALEREVGDEDRQ